MRAAAAVCGSAMRAAAAVFGSAMRAAAAVFGSAMRAAAAVFGSAMLAVPAVTGPLPALALVGPAALLLACSLIPHPGSWALAATPTASAALLACVIWPPGTVMLAVEGLLILGYLLLLDGHSAARQWLRGQVWYGVAGLAAAAVVLAALALPSAASAWVVLAGLAAAAAAYLVALPRRDRSTRP
jgi:hypothetical protein